MHVLVATDGKLGTSDIVDFVAPLARDGSATVVTVTEIPRRLLRDLREDFGEQLVPAVDADAEYVSAPGGGQRPGAGYPGDDRIIGQYLRNREADICAPIVEALNAAGVKTDSASLDGENAAATVLDYAANNGADLIVVGSHGQGRFEGLLGSTGVRITRLSPVPVLMLRCGD